MFPGLAMAMLPPGLPAAPELPADGAPRSRAARRKQKGGGARPAAAAEAGAGSAAGAPPGASQRAEALPKQRPGESARAYSARLGKAAEKQLKEARRKLNTDHHREKKRKRAQDKKKAAEEKRRTRAGAGEQEESRQQARFGDIVHRPPIMSSAALKSRSSLKAQAKVPEGARSGGDLGAYADKVREAYAALRKRRLGEG
ncbi:unnamed protein product [Prorocentrum cordatum]|uniref:Uncharacterized protein n=1 Tax=Prorocentrum cordatum TaxID=2364126 RepID=A0ABN9TQC9_9DINO|nr:unnamed protein product [Polarella glacialis]